MGADSAVSNTERKTETSDNQDTSKDLLDAPEDNSSTVIVCFPCVLCGGCKNTKCSGEDCKVTRKTKCRCKAKRNTGIVLTSLGGLSGITAGVVGTILATFCI